MTDYTIITLKISTDFTNLPGARYRTDGDNSGQEFFEEVMGPKLREIWSDKKKRLLLDLDDTEGYASSFLSEVFIRVVREFKDRTQIKERILIKSDEEPLLIDTINKTIDETPVE